MPIAYRPFHREWTGLVGSSTLPCSVSKVSAVDSLNLMWQLLRSSCADGRFLASTFSSDSISALIYLEYSPFGRGAKFPRRILSANIGNELASKGSFKQQSWYSTTPAAQMSAFDVYALPSTISGDRYPGVPAKTLESIVWLLYLAIPKSPTLQTSSLPRNMFAPLMSLWMISL